MKEPSIFTKIIKREIPAKIVYEDDEFIAIHDIKPSAPVDVLLIFKEEHPTMEYIDLENENFHHKFLLTARKVARKLGIQDNYKIVMNVGKQVQLVHHIHLHIMGGWDETKHAEEIDAETEI